MTRPKPCCPACGTLLDIRKLSERKRLARCLLRICGWERTYAAGSKYDDSGPHDAISGHDIPTIARLRREFLGRQDHQAVGLFADGRSRWEGAP